MRGLAERRQGQIEERVWLDYLQAEMIALARVGKPRSFDEYLRRVRPRGKATPGEMLARLQDVAARSGGALRITQVS